mmetsp:Transcript_12493/g.17855  ORF Transcript_12493/g.17855 Transcript_12493/m.17855 type:complete len:624 (-) Transcript_12493:179-2050(-)|eukprot:CAMPEP_0184856962 /NCGR_PEP_ID=MMETSP0580-20130426/2130_1 /TAXON_ID=1118495 /ORGANISM="Dactyliosolen fragilissimus" /LENGTH=623 /DNA_ID=CAMNT_0027352289 /DNA_START=186 /DNA_END=2057 /DNA_ORIENTATION=+
MTRIMIIQPATDGNGGGTSTNRIPSNSKLGRKEGMEANDGNNDYNDNDNNLNPSLKSLVIPWSILVLAAILAAFFTSTSAGNIQTLTKSQFQSQTQLQPQPQSQLQPQSESENSLFSVKNSLFSVKGTLLSQMITSSSSSSTRHLGEKEEKYTFEEEHASLLPLTTSDYMGFFFAILGLVVAAGGGIGGGGILVPIYILILRFSPKHAIPLSNVTVFGGSLANTFLNMSKRHPFADRPLVDWDLILVMEPLTIAGALLGAFLNKLLPEELLVVLLVALLSFTAYNTLKKAIKMYKKESAQILQQQKQAAAKESELTTVSNQQSDQHQLEAQTSLLADVELQEGEAIGSSTNHDTPHNDHEQSYNSNNSNSNSTSSQLQKILEEEKTTPTGNLTMLIVMFIVVLFINLLKGGGAFPSPIGIECGSSSFWIANILMLGWIFLISLLARSYLVRRHALKAKLNYPYVEGDIQWDARATIVYPIVCCLAGFFAGMFGVGGGIVKGPLMLAMGVHPAVSSASSACMILFTSFTATTSFWVFGLLIPDYALICLCIGFTATFLGQIALNHLMKKAQRNSYIAFSIGGVVLLSAFLMTIQSLVSLAEKAQAGDDETAESHASGGICGVSH